MRELLSELDQALARGQRCVWCAVVETRGSTPQKAGAAMLVFPDGGQRGTLGGGCVEAEVKGRALAVLSSGEAPRPQVFTFCLDDDYGWDDGLICGGRMTVLADPLDGADLYHRAFREQVEAGGCVEAVAIGEQAGAPVGSRYLFDAAGRLVAHRADVPVPAALYGHRPDLSRRPGPSVVQGVAYLPVLPRVTLVIVGGGHVGQAVARLAAESDFAIEVLDDREAYTSAERFPQARRFVGDIDAVLRERAPALGPSHYALIVTRGHRHDEEALYHLAPTAAGYVGMIGSKRKIKLIYEDLIARGVAPEALARVHAPLGFDIGSQTVPEIAVSIVAELIACRNLGTTAIRPRSRVQPGTLRGGGAAP
jgi:xanthine dehydrogenase accessory factor